jgi:hypothetical protein
MASEHDKNEAMARILLQKSIGSQRISIAANCPIMTLLMNRDDRKINEQKTDELETSISPSASQSEIESLQVELENLLTDAGMRYLNLQQLTNPDTSNKKELGLNTSKLNKSKTSEINREIPFYHLAKPVTFTDIEKRAKLLQDASKERNISLNPIDKNRNEHLERFWSAVEDFVGSIPQETMEFLKQLSEYDEENDVDVRPKVLVKKESVDTDDLGPPSKKRKKNAKSKSSKKEETETTKMTWEYQLLAAENAPISKSLENTKLEVHDSTGFGELTSRIISALVDERIDPEISNSVQKLIQEVAHEKLTEKPKDSTEKPTDSENLTINTTQFNNSLEERIALELLQAGLISTSDCVNALGGGNDDSSDSNENTSETNEKSINSVPTNQTNTPTTYIDHELTALREQLKIVQKENASTAKVLYQRAIVHNKRHKGLKNLENIDWLLLDYYRKVQASRTRRRPINRKERETIEELLFKRQDVIDSM